MPRQSTALRYRCRVTIGEVLQRSAAFLQRHGVDSPRLQTELLLAHQLQLPRLQLYLNHDRVLTVTELASLRALVQRRAQRVPLQHLVGSTNFFGLELCVSPAALIPRPETEILAELAGAVLLKVADPTPVVLDFGTGTGCLALALATHDPRAQLHALDVSAAALALARRNVTQLGLAERVTLHEGDGFGALPAGLRFHLLVTNPPYIPTAEIATLQEEVRDHDPRNALDGGADGLDFYRQLATEAPTWLVSGGGLLAEFGDGQEAILPELFAAAGWTCIQIHPDLSGRARVLEAWRCEPV